MAVEVNWAKVSRISDIPLQHDETACINDRNGALVRIQKKPRLRERNTLSMTLIRRHISLSRPNKHYSLS